MRSSTHSTYLHALVAALAMAALTACGDTTAPTERAALQPDPPSLSSSGPVLVECPTDVSISTTGTLGSTGGVITVGRHELRLPLLGVLLPTQFSLTVPSSNYMELTVEAVGQSGFTFNEPATITIDYSRCTRSNLDKAPLTVWKIDPVTKELLEFMGGVDDKEARTVRFQTGHLSTYSIAQ